MALYRKKQSHNPTISLIKWFGNNKQTNEHSFQYYEENISSSTCRRANRTVNLISYILLVCQASIICGRYIPVSNWVTVFLLTLIGYKRLILFPRKLGELFFIMSCDHQIEDQQDNCSPACFR